MLRNYFLVAARSLRQNLGFTILNIFGLAAGLACTILIGLWVADEVSYDAFHPNADRTYRVLNTFDMPKLQATLSTCPALLGPTLKDEYAQVEQSVRVLNNMTTGGTVRTENRAYVEPSVLFVDGGFFDVFGLSIERGTAQLDEPGTVLLTPPLVDKYFPDSDPIGQTIQMDGTQMAVTGIVASAPTNTHLDYSIIASLATRSLNENWGHNDLATYVTLRPGTSEEAFERSALQAVSRKHLPTTTDAGELQQYFHLQPVTGIHLNLGAPSLENGAGTGNATYVALFGALAVFVLLLACINFMNLSTARSSERANEVGLRKAMGAGRAQLAGQFLGESMLITVAGMLLALAVSATLLPSFNDVAGKSIGLATLFSPTYLVAYAGLLVAVGLVAGLYPALVLTGYSPIETLRGRSTSSQGSPTLRKVLVVFQFAISIVLIIGTAVVHQQVDHLRSKGLGFDEQGLLVVEQARGLADPLQSRADVSTYQRRLDSFQDQVQQISGVKATSASFSLPGTTFINSMFPLDAPDAEAQNMNYSFVGYDYAETLGLTMVAGRDFSREHPTDTAAVMINEAAAQQYGLSPREAVGTSIRRGNTAMEIVGVVEDFHYASLHNEIYPLILFHRSVRAPQYVAVRLADGSDAAALSEVKQAWSQFSDLPFNYSFLANDLAAQYAAEARMERLFVGFAGLAILIACLGLFGLAAYAARQRTKEIGIRKALGATAQSVIALLSKDFLLLVGFAFVVAVPAAYYAMDQWLHNFSYRIDLGVGVFMLAGAIAFLIATVAVSTQALRAAQTDPSEALRA
jgi:putative ABC transport system permease protein